MGRDQPEPTVSKMPSLAACCVAEVLGTFLLVFFGCGAVHVAVLTGALEGLWQIAIVWGVVIMVAIYCIVGISGAHINPAITIALTFWGHFPVARAAPYVAAQLLGAFAAACVLFVLFEPFLDQKEKTKNVVRGEPGSEITAMCYCEYFPSPGPMGAGEKHYSAEEHKKHNLLVSEPAACLAEILGTAILALAVMAVTDKRNPANPGVLAPVFIGLTVSILICVIAPLTQACFNPARDFGPRLFAWLAGWGEIALPGPRYNGFFTVYIFSPIVGAVGGMMVYRIVLQPHMYPTREI